MKTKNLRLCYLDYLLKTIVGLSVQTSIEIKCLLNNLTALRLFLFDKHTVYLPQAFLVSMSVVSMLSCNLHVIFSYFLSFIRHLIIIASHTPLQLNYRKVKRLFYWN